MKILLIVMTILLFFVSCQSEKMEVNPDSLVNLVVTPKNQSIGVDVFNPTISIVSRYELEKGSLDEKSFLLFKLDEFGLPKEEIAIDIVDDLVNPHGIYLKPKNNLQAFTTYQVIVMSGLKDIMGFIYPGISWTFVTGTDDRTLPEILSTYPNLNQLDVPVDCEIKINFSEAILPASINEKSIMLINKSNGEFVLGDLSYNQDTFDVIFSPSTELAPDTEYQIYINERISDLASLALVGVQINFKTANQ